MRLRPTDGAEKEQDRVFKKLVPKLASASVWQAAGIEAGMGYDAFREGVRPVTYDDLAPEIDRMKRGEADVLWPGTCHLYAQSPGRNHGEAKTVPVTEPMLRHFRNSGLDSFLWYSARAKSRAVFRGRHLFLGGSTSLAPIPDCEPFEAYTGDVSAIAALNLPGWVEQGFFEPGSEIAQIADWKAKIAAITERTADADISLLAGIPVWVLLLAGSLLARGARGGGRASNLQQIWPNLQCYMHGGVPVTPYYDELRAMLGPTVNFHEVYEASEGYIAAQDADSAAGLRMMADAGIFFEFLPMSDYDESRIRSLGPKFVPISGVKAGVDYALVAHHAGRPRPLRDRGRRALPLDQAAPDHLRRQDRPAAERILRAGDGARDHRRLDRGLQPQRLVHREFPRRTVLLPRHREPGPMPP